MFKVIVDEIITKKTPRSNSRNVLLYALREAVDKSLIYNWICGLRCHVDSHWLYSLLDIRCTETIHLPVNKPADSFIHKMDDHSDGLLCRLFIVICCNFKVLMWICSVVFTREHHVFTSMLQHVNSLFLNFALACYDCWNPVWFHCCSCLYTDPFSE